MAEVRPFCPKCTSLEITFGVIAQEVEGGRPASCALCGWEGQERELLAAASSEEFWDIEKVGHVLLTVFAKHGVGPLVQALEYVGMVEPDDVEGKEVIIKAVMEAALPVIFEAAHEVRLQREQRSKFQDEDTTDIKVPHE